MKILVFEVTRWGANSAGWRWEAAEGRAYGMAVGVATLVEYI